MGQTTEQRAFIVSALAYCTTPEIIIYKFKERFKPVTCTLDDIAACDPRRLTGEWRRYFDDERLAFYQAPNDKAFRMAVLSGIITAENSRGGNHPTVLKALELLAKEEAGFYTPKAKGEGGDGAPSSFTFGLDRVSQD